MPCKFINNCVHKSGWCDSNAAILNCTHGLNMLCDERIIKIDDLQCENDKLKRLLRLAVNDLNELAQNAIIKNLYDMFVTKQMTFDHIINGKSCITWCEWKHTDEAKGLIEKHNDT